MLKELYENGGMTEIKSKIIIYSERKYGEPKLPKPKELKNIKQSFSVDWIVNKCRCQCFVYGKDLWIKHRDFNSTEIYGVENKNKGKFIYKDNFGCVVLRGEAWLLIKDFVLDMENKIFETYLFYNLAEQATCKIGVGIWERFFESVIKNYIIWSELNDK